MTRVSRKTGGKKKKLVLKVHDWSNLFEVAWHFWQVTFTVISSDVGDEEVQDEEGSAPHPPVADSAADLFALSALSALAPLAPVPVPTAPVPELSLSKDQLMLKFKTIWGPSFKPTNILKTGVKGSTTDEREDFLTVLKGIAKKYVDRNNVVKDNLDRSRSRTIYLSLPFSLSLSLSHSLSTVFVHHIVLDAWLSDNPLGERFFSDV